MTSSHSTKVSLDLTGLKFNRLLAIEKTDRRSAGHVVWKFKCDCGNFHFAAATEVKSGRTKSCGCFLLDFLRSTKTTHGATVGGRHTKLYRAWEAMHARCKNPKHKHYHRYGGRGISVCERWHEFANFAADMGDAPPGLSLDRINNDGNYELSNCRWATYIEQNSNRCTNARIEVNGESKTIEEWSRASGRNSATIWGRLRRGLTPSDAVYGPLDRIRKPRN